MSPYPHIFLTGRPSVGKTTIIKALQESLQNKFKDLVTKGFFTEECRSQSGDRIGFDILYWQKNDTELGRQPLSRIVATIKKSDPHVGKYKVDVQNVEEFAVKSISKIKGYSHGKDTPNKELMVIDEVGKMEMLCPQFLPAVHDILNENTSPDMKRIVIGTIPTPRYGRVIQAIEEIRARDDVIILHVTKENRNEVKDVLQNVLKGIFHNGNEMTGKHLRKVLSKYKYARPIGASSINGNGKVKTAPEVNGSFDDGLKACGPLYGETVKPKILLLGQTASPLPENTGLSYSERSMWIVLGRMFEIKYKPIKDFKTTTESDIETYLDLQQTVLSRGICVWDVLANVHVPRTVGGRKEKRQKITENKPNEIEAFLRKHPSIKMIAFIGEKARKTFLCEVSNELSKIELVTLPSSSSANSRMTVHEKVSAWKGAFSKYIPSIP